MTLSQSALDGGISVKNVILAIILATVVVADVASAQRRGLTVSFGDSASIFNTFTFSPDGKRLYTSERIVSRMENGRPIFETWGDNRPKTSIFEYQIVNGELTGRKEVEFADGVHDFAPHMNFAGTRIYFNSRRPLADEEKSDGKLHSWYSEIQNGKWSRAKQVEGINLAGVHTAYVQELDDGSLVFQSDRAGSVAGRGGGPSLDLWITRRFNGRYLEPENLRSINSEYDEGAFVVSKNGKLLIFTRVVEREMEVCVSVKKQGEWEPPRPLHLTSASGFVEQSPRLSPNGKTFYFAHNALILEAPLRDLLNSEEAAAVGLSGKLSN
ncbi:MAG: PD40 domain-containing protein [Chloracidobacterium sp.]|nr:PD40 domain-containing protein [Chloracidobacterium sp.]